LLEKDVKTRRLRHDQENVRNALNSEGFEAMIDGSVTLANGISQTCTWAIALQLITHAAGPHR
jgi:hypothetical protein